MSPGKALGPLRTAIHGLPAVLDQAVFAATNFILTLVLARTVGPADFGAFTLWFSVLVLIGTLYGSVVIGPMLVYATTRYAHDWRGYLGALCRAHLPLVVLPACAVVVVASVFSVLGQGQTASYLAALALATPGVLLLWLARSACFVQGRTRYLAPAGGIGYLVVVLGAMYAWRDAGVDGAAVLLVMGGAGLLVGGVMLALLRPRLGRHDDPELTLRSVATAHRSFGAWLVGITTLTWLMLNAYPFLIRWFDSLEAAGGFRADLNLLSPLFQGTSAVCILFTPVLARARASRSFRRQVRSLVLLLGGAGLAFWLIVAVLAEFVVRLSYGDDFVQYASLLPLLASVCALNAVAGTYGAALRAIERPVAVFRAYGWATIALLGLGFVLVPAAGLTGAAVGTAVAWVVAVLLLRRACWSEWRAVFPAIDPRRSVTIDTDGQLWAPFEVSTPVRPVVPEPPEPVERVEAPPAPVRGEPASARRPVVGTALLALAPLTLVVLAFDRNGAFARAPLVRNLLPIALVALVGGIFLLSGQAATRRPERADVALLALAGYVVVGYALRVHRADTSVSEIGITLVLLVGATHLLVTRPLTAGQCRQALRNISWAGVPYATTFAAANAGLLGETAQTFFKQMQSSILLVPLAAAVVSKRWALAAFMGGTYAFGFLTYSGAATHREAGHGGTYLVVAAAATLVFLTMKGRHRRARVFRVAAMAVVLAGAFLVVRSDSGPAADGSPMAAVFQAGNESSSFRTEVWSVAVSEIATSPVLGHQFAGTFVLDVAEYRGIPLLVHNDLLQLTLDGGLLALGLYLVVAVDANRRALRSYQPFRGAGMSAHAQLTLLAVIGFDAFLVVGLFNPALLTTSVATMGFAMYAALRAVTRTPVETNDGALFTLTAQPAAGVR